MAQQTVDLRRVRLSIEFDGQLKVYEGLDIKSTGWKYANALQNEAEVQVSGLTSSDRDYILTATSPFNKNRTPKLLLLEAGTVSSGVSRIYQGDISSCQPSQPPDNVLKFKCQTNAFLKGQITATQQPSLSTLRKVALQAAKDLSLQLVFEATDKNVANYSYSGAALQQINKIGTLGKINAFIDDDKLVVKDVNLPLAGQERVIDKYSGMRGIPELTEQGIKVTYLLDHTTVLGGSLQVVSTQYPTTNGQYVIYKLGWNITSREDPFYWIAECLRIDQSGNVVVPSGVKQRKGKHK